MHRFAAFQANMDERWSQLVEGVPDDWHDVGASVDDALAASAGRWRIDMAEFARRVLADGEVQAANEPEMLRRTAKHFTATLRSSLPGGAVERLNA